MDEKMKYDLRGVSATKDEVHAAIKGLDKGLYPRAFCKIIPDAVGADPDFCNIMHADTAGTKTSLAYLYWKETGDLSVWRGIAQDALVMNLDDMACVGCYQDIVISSTIGRNKNLISGDVIATIIQAAEDLAAQLGDMGIRLHMAGGETADVGDIVRTIDVGYTAFARMRRKDTIVNDIRPGDVIVGMASYGQATYEEAYNGGMGSNGLTSARHDVLAKAYAAKYPDSFDPNIPDAVIFTGSKKLTDKIEIAGHGAIDVGKLILSPTRTFLPVLRPLIEDHRDKIHGIIHCTGGGQTKVQKFIGNVRVIKDNLFDLPPLFKMIQEESGTGWKEMYQVFNMGNRMEVYLAPKHADLVIRQAQEFGIDAQVIGRVEAADQPEVRIESPFGIFEY
jgi:phosphoribosylformylglycinamidine cyclo-ligase